MKASQTIFNWINRLFQSFRRKKIIALWKCINAQTCLAGEPSPLLLRYLQLEHALALVRTALHAPPVTWKKLRTVRLSPEFRPIWEHARSEPLTYNYSPRERLRLSRAMKIVLDDFWDLPVEAGRAEALAPAQWEQFLEEACQRLRPEFQRSISPSDLPAQIRKWARWRRPKVRVALDWANDIAEPWTDASVAIRPLARRTFKAFLLMMFLAVLAALAWQKWDSITLGATALLRTLKQPRVVAPVGVPILSSQHQPNHSPSQAESETRQVARSLDKEIARDSTIQTPHTGGTQASVFPSPASSRASNSPSPSQPSQSFLSAAPAHRDADLGPAPPSATALTSAVVTVASAGAVLPKPILATPTNNPSPRQIIPTEPLTVSFKPGGSNATVVISRGNRSIQLSFCMVPSASYTRGNDAKDAPRSRGRVFSFFIGADEISEEAWGIVMNLPLQNYEKGSVAKSRVSWRQAQEFCQTMSSAIGARTVRLPMEIEWEYVAQLHRDQGFSGVNNLFSGVREWMQDAYGEDVYRSYTSNEKCPSGSDSPDTAHVIRGSPSEGSRGVHTRWKASDRGSHAEEGFRLCIPAKP